MNFLFLDTETTGLNNPRLVSLAFNISGTNLINHAYYKPPVEIEEGASKVNGITNDMVKDLPPFQGSKDKLHVQQLLDQLVLVCHNVKFDAQVLVNEGLRVKMKLCTVEIAKAMYTQFEKHNLQVLKDNLELHSPFSKPHSSVGDVITLKKLFQKMYSDKVKDFDGDKVRAQSYISSFISGM